MKIKVPFNGSDMSQITSEKEVEDWAEQVPRGTCRELSNLIMGLVKYGK